MNKKIANNWTYTLIHDIINNLIFNGIVCTLMNPYQMVKSALNRNSLYIVMLRRSQNLHMTRVTFKKGTSILKAKLNQQKYTIR